MGLIKSPFVFERFDVVVYDESLGIKLCQLDSGSVCVLAFVCIGVRGDEKGAVEASGKVRVGDALLCIDECPIELLQYEEAMRRLKELQRPLSLTFGRTEKSIADKVGTLARTAVARDRDFEEQARLRQLDLERSRRQAAQQSSSSLSGASRLIGAVRGRANTVNGVGDDRALYTAKDFDGKRLRPVHKLALGIAVMMILVVIGLILDIDVFNMTSRLDYSESGKVELYHAHATSKKVFQEEIAQVSAHANAEAEKADIERREQRASNKSKPKSSKESSKSRRKSRLGRKP